VISPTWITCVRKGVIGRSRIKIVDIVDLVTSILGKWTSNLAIHIQMVNRTTNFI